jgi:WD40 repeat protein
VIVDGHDGQIWGIACHPTEPIFVTGGWDNAIKAWDAPSRKCTKTLEFPLEKGDKHGKKVSQVAFSNDGTLLMCGTEDSNLVIVSWPEFEFKGFVNIPPKSKSAPVEAVSYIRFTEDDKHVAVAHMDSNVYIFDIKRKDGEVELKQWAPLKQGTAPTHVRWSADSKHLQSFTRDYEIQTWNIDLKKKKGKFEPFLPDPDKIEWAADPLIAGWDVQGLYQTQEGWDGTDLNDASLSPDKQYIVSGDDYGYLRLHRYPAIDQTACYKYPGHAEFVVGIEFLETGDEVISCGGADMCVVQWKLVDGGEEEE